ncbi:MAG: DUF2948 family protein [Hyphomicrobiales bacterium]
MDRLKLAALDQSDLEVISAHMQDAVLTRSDIRYWRSKGKFALLANRFAWDAVSPGKRGRYQRRLSGLQFARVLSVRSCGISRDGDTVLCLLSIGFEQGEPPSGAVVLTFAGGGTIRLEVECIEAQLDDLGPAWETARAPSHEDGERIDAA